MHYSFGSLFKTFWNILGLPYLNQYDAGATDLAEFFTDTPDYTPYNALPVDIRIFDPQKALDPFDEKFDWKAVKESPKIDNVEDMFRESKEQDKDRLENREKRSVEEKSGNRSKIMGKKNIGDFSIKITRFYFGRENIRLTVTENELISESSIAVNKKNYSLTRRKITGPERKSLKKFLSGFPLKEFKESYYNKGVKDGMQLQFEIRINETEKNIYVANYYIEELGELVAEIAKLLPKDNINYSKDNGSTEIEM